jgi:hypothetical protein
MMRFLKKKLPTLNKVINKMIGWQSGKLHFFEVITKIFDALGKK